MAICYKDCWQKSKVSVSSIWQIMIKDSFFGGTKNKNAHGKSWHWGKMHIQCNMCFIQNRFWGKEKKKKNKKNPLDKHILIQLSSKSPVTTTYILYFDERLIHNCKPFWVPWAAGISEWTIPLPAVIHCKSPGPIVPLCPSKSSCLTAPYHQIIAQNLGNSITCRFRSCWKFKIMTKVVLVCRLIYILTRFRG